MKTTSSPPWSLVEHLERLGLHPVLPQLDVWAELSTYLGEKLGDDTGVEFFLHHLRKQKLGFAYAPVIATVYEWANRNHRDILPFNGTINTEANVRHAMLSYVTDQVAHRGLFTGLDDTLIVLSQHAPLPAQLCEVLDKKLNVQEQVECSTWIAPLTGKMPRVAHWEAMRDGLLSRYDTRDSDEFAMEGVKNAHWLTNHRVELVIAAWLAGSSKFFSASLYSQLPNIKMDEPDQVTALFWLVALDYTKHHPERVESSIVAQWMAQYPQYHAFVEERKSMVEGLMGEDPVPCSELLHTMWNERHEARVGVGLETTLDGLLLGQ